MSVLFEQSNLFVSIQLSLIHSAELSYSGRVVMAVQQHLCTIALLLFLAAGIRSTASQKVIKPSQGYGKFNHYFV